MRIVGTLGARKLLLLCATLSGFTMGTTFALNGSLAAMSSHRENNVAETIPMTLSQGPNLDYSKFLHTSQRHTSLGCTSCHERASDNSQIPRLPGHKACTNCHLAQFVNPDAPMCAICHANISAGNPPLKSFPQSFNEHFNVKFDHAQHLTAAVKPRNGCQACHDKMLARGAGYSIPAGISAHEQCYSCHKPDSKSSSGKEIASCGVCHEERTYSPTTTAARGFRYAFTHIKHGTRERLDCADCHTVTAGLAQSRQVSSPSPSQHFLTAGGMSCGGCHNGRKTFGGDLAFSQCRRCHTGNTFRMPM